MAIVAVQNANGNNGFLNDAVVNITLPGAPTNGNTIVLMASAAGIGTATLVNNIVQTGASWVLAGTVKHVGSGTITEIWYAQNVSGALAGITINYNSIGFHAGVAIEYSGIRAFGGIVDQLGTSQGGTTNTPTSGAAPATTRSEELWISGFQTDLNNILSTPPPSTTTYAHGGFLDGWAFEELVTSIGVPSHTITVAFSANYAALIVAFLGESLEGEGTSSIEFDATATGALEIAASGEAAIEFEGSALFKLEGLTPDEIGILEAISGAIGEADTEIGGLFQTRLLVPLPQATALSPVLTWNGTVIITTGDTTEADVDDWLRLDVDGQFFKVVAVVPNVSYEIENPEGLLIPSGNTTSSKAITVIPVETTYLWADEGKISINGVVYHYTGKTQQSLTGITHTLNGRSIPGLLRAHNTTVVDITQIRSAMDLVRRAMLVDFAEGDDLNALGRNLGVLRLPFLASDDQFREIIKALAYNPRGTIYGLELALNGLVGEGNYEIFEDLITFPNTVFIRLTGAASTSDVEQGKAYTTDLESNPATSDTTVDIQNSVVDRGHVGSVRWKDEDHLTDCRLAFPTADLISEYNGQVPATPWTIFAGVEGVDYTLVATDGGSLEWTTSTFGMRYRRLARIQPESTARLSMLVNMPSAGSLLGSYEHGIQLADTDGILSAGFRDGPSGATFRVAFCEFAGGTIIGANVLTLNRDQYYDIEIRKNGREPVELWVDGKFQFSEPYASFPSPAGISLFEWGRFLGPRASLMRVKQARYYANTVTDYWGTRGADASVNSGDPVLFGSGTVALILGTDEGKRIITRNSGVTNPQGGNNNGVWLIDTVLNASQANLIGPPQMDATFQAGNPGRITVDTLDREFQFPDDLGKTFVVESGANAGSYIIEKILDDISFADLGSGASPPPAQSRVCEVVGAPVWVSETGIPWHLEPAFATEGFLEWEMSDAGSFVGMTLTLRQALPLTGAHPRVLDVLYSDVLSAQVLLDESVSNLLFQEIPDLLFTYYPFYISDPLGFVRTYLDDITAAGVIPDFIEE